VQRCLTLALETLNKKLVDKRTRVSPQARGVERNLQRRENFKDPTSCRLFFPLPFLLIRRCDLSSRLMGTFRLLIRSRNYHPRERNH
jgi:hypothetical protein